MAVGEMSTKFDVFPAKVLGLGKQILKVGFKAWPHTKLVCRFRGNPLRDGWDLLSRNLGPKAIKKVLRNDISRSQLL